MAHKAASKKSIRQIKVKTLKNRSAISRIKTERKKFVELAMTGAEGTAEQFSLTQSLLAKAAKTGLIHWKKAARLTSRMSRKMASRA